MNHFLIFWTIRDGENEYEQHVIVATNKDFSKDELFGQALEKFYGTPANYSLPLESWELDGDYRLIQSSVSRTIPQNKLDTLRSFFPVIILL